MSAQVIPFPKKHDPTTPIDSEEAMVAWSTWMYCVESKQYSLEDAEHLGRALWRAFQDRAAGSDVASKRRRLNDAIQKALSGWLFAGDASARGQIQNFLRVHYHVNTVDQIPEDCLDDAIAIVRSMELSAWHFLIAMTDVKRAFERQVFGGNEPWTPAIRRKLKRPAGERPNWRVLAEEMEQQVR